MTAFVFLVFIIAQAMLQLFLDAKADGEENRRIRENQKR